ncbi:neuronal acetylcholine receptor subunit alpha-10-like [Eurosta solidaginis]|uniref:neuronal acetylcholine receptor subunit alpha-10-like n=1 Tax=Eurosta solidaginis TaxID=178769 RepID=UPI0035311A99
MKNSKLIPWYSLQIVFLVIFSMEIAVDSKFYSASVARRSLITDLFVNYDAATKPAPKGERIDLHANLVLQHFDFQESDGSFHFVGLLDVAWRDPKLAWNPIDYNNLTRIPVRQKLIWVPDLEVYNNAPDKFLRMHHNGIVILEHTGMVLWSDNVEINMFCTTLMNDWPHDKHECKLSLGSWTYDGFELDFMNNTNPNGTIYFDEIDMTSMEYNIIEFGVERVATVYSCCAEPYITMDYHLTFERRCAYVIVFRMLTLTVVILSLLALRIETSYRNRICINGLNLIVIAMILIYFANNIGKFSRNTPLIVQFFSYSFILIALQQTITVFSIFATHAPHRGNLHPKISNFLRNSFVSYITPQKNFKILQIETGDWNDQIGDMTYQDISTLISADDAPYEWMKLASFIESNTLILFIVIYIILASVCFV